MGLSISFFAFRFYLASVRHHVMIFAQGYKRALIINVPNKQAGEREEVPKSDIGRSDVVYMVDMQVNLRFTLSATVSVAPEYHRPRA